MAQITTPQNAMAQRHALGLPAGSVRAIHVLTIVGTICALLFVVPRSGEPIPIPPYLVYLLFLVVGHFFASHGVSIAARGSGASPLFLPGGVVRFLVLSALAGSMGWKYYSDPDGFYSQFERTIDQLKEQPLVPLMILGGFLFGVMIKALIGRFAKPVALQDLQAWLSVLAITGLGIAAVLHLVVAPNVEQQYSLPLWEGILGAVVAFYFGERS